MRKGHRRGRLARVVLCAAIAVALGPGILPATAAFAAGGDFYVSVTGTNNAACSQTSPCTTISEAVAAAGSSGTINVGPGTFADYLNIQSGTYTILGDPAETTITPSADTDMIDLGGSASLTIENVTLDNLYYGYIVYQTGGAFSLIDSSMTGGPDGLQQVGGSAALSNDMFTDISELPVQLSVGSGSVTVAGTTIQGGYYGISQLAGTLTVTDSTITQAAQVAIPVLGGSASIVSSTITGSGDGLLAENSGSISVSGSILADNHGTIQDPAADIFPTDITGANCYGPVTDGGYNLSTDQSCAFTATGSQNNVTDAQLNLGPLQFNGGPTQTQEPGPGSVAIDAIPAADTALCTGTDQRGVSRPQGSGCDIGSVEVVSPGEGDIGFQPLVVSVPPGGSFTLTVTAGAVNLIVLAPNAIGVVFAVGLLNPITVSDTRNTYPGWSVSGQAANFTGSGSAAGGTISPTQLGWYPSGSSLADGVTLGLGTLPANPGMGTTPQLLAQAPAGYGFGTSVLGAELQLEVPSLAPAGPYTSVLTVTAVTSGL